ncbi:unnamed protein product [Ambrosiozyma monospora]|uniref:Unnamed protein product n=1 Tax=Ambrosiozyma monospora TaxID=43982 RepID=A0ACB5U7C3_AMBMO|nr:unnamed protein product [Ambrosiozyma monospora]
MLSVPNVFVRPSGAGAKRIADEKKQLFAHGDGDHLTLLNVYHAFKSDETREMGLHKWCKENYLSYRSLKSADNVRWQLSKLMERYDIELNSGDFDDPNYYTNIRKALTAGFFMQVAKRKSTGKGYITVKDSQEVLIHPSTVLGQQDEWVIYNEFVLTSKNYIRTVTAIRPEWLIELAPVYYNLEHFHKDDVKMSLERVKARYDKKIELQEMEKEKKTKKSKKDKKDKKSKK